MTFIASFVTGPVTITVVSFIGRGFAPGLSNRTSTTFSVVEVERPVEVVVEPFVVVAGLFGAVDDVDDVDDVDATARFVTDFLGAGVFDEVSFAALAHAVVLNKVNTTSATPQ